MLCIPSATSTLRRLPSLAARYDRKTDRLHFSTASFRLNSLRWPGRLALRLGHAVGVVFLSEGGGMVTCNNLTIINLLLKLTGPLHERRVTQALLALQVGPAVQARPN